MRIATDRRDLARQRGFTLPEVLATLGVLGVSLSLAVPGLDSITRSNLRATGINELVATLHVARSEAITRNTRIAICPSADGQHCGDVDWDAGWIRFADPNGDFRLGPEEVVLGASPSVPGLAVRSAAFNRGLGFAPSGRPLVPDSDQHSGDFTICASSGGADPRLLHVGPSGAPILASRQADGRELDCSREPQLRG